jgi:uncharacterized membrane protein
MDVLEVSLFSAAFLTGLIAGLFYSYSCSVNLGLAKLRDIEYLKAMKAINKAILNPWFFLSFIGSLVAIPLSTTLYYYNTGVDASFYLLLSASAAYIVGVFGVTIRGNVPLNEELDRFNIEQAAIPDITLKRKGFEEPWNKFHLARSIANVAAFAFILVAIIIKS